MKNISVKGARTHNLKSIDVSLPRDKLIVITGLSGSGKSSLAFDTLYAEGQRRYVESLSAYARQFLAMMDKPDVDHIEGLSPAISIEQKTTSHNPRSTVGTVTELYDYLRLLFARIGKARCPTHNTSLEAKTITQMVSPILALPEGSKIILMAPLVKNRKGEHHELFQSLSAQGFIRVRVNGKIMELTEVPALARHKNHSIDVIIDRLSIRSDLKARLTDSFETALRLGKGLACVQAILPDQTLQEHTFSANYACIECGYSLTELEPRLFSFNSPIGACPQCDGLGKQGLSLEPCSACKGTRLKKEARHVFINNHSLPDITHYAISDTLTFFKNLNLKGQDSKIADKIITEIKQRLQFLANVGLNYLSLDRTAETLSGGEAQRIRLASQIGAGLVGVMYILDEPSIGLHQRDNTRLLDALKKLRDLGNTVIMVEHDMEAILEADHILDLGPGAGTHGGNVMAQGSPSVIKKSKASLTGQYLAGTKKIEVPKTRKKPDLNKMITLSGVNGHNLKNITVHFPIGLFSCVTGVSGSGKSTLINDTLYPLAAHLLNGADLGSHQAYKSLSGLEYLNKVVCIDQSPIGRTPRSNAATYTGTFNLIRELIANTPEARSRGYTIGRFSFNVKGGRCEACEGAGLLKIEMHFLSDVYVQCDTCQGQRYNAQTLEIRYKGKNIHDILELTIEDACTFFKAIPAISRKLQTLVDVGLSYLTLGQSATTLSGGEAQRVKLAKELSRRDTGQTLYILDEPTTGLHFHDVQQLLIVLSHLQARGNTIIVIEHNLDVIKTADWIVDLGPEGGDKGGELVAMGMPEAIAKTKQSYTGQYLKKILKN